MTTKVVVYTAAIGPRSILHPLPDFKKKCDYRAFIWPNYDGSQLKASGWDVQTAQIVDTDMRRVARYYKCLPHRVLPAHDISIWVDASLLPATDLHPLAETLKDAQLAGFPHPRRNCIYQEFRTVMAEDGECDYPRDNLHILRGQEQWYHQQNYPKDNGMWENGITIRRNTPEVQEFNEFWWEEVRQGTREDQISMAYSVWAKGIKGIFLGPGSTCHNPFVHLVGHTSGFGRA